MTFRKALAYALLLAALAAVAWLGWSAARASMQARLALADLNRIEAVARDLKIESLPALNEQVAALDLHLTSTRTAARPFLWLASRLGWLPSIGPSLRALSPLLNMAVDMAGGGHQTLDALEPILALAGSPGHEDLIAQAVLALATAAPELAAAETRVARAEQERAAIREPLHPRLASLIGRLDRVLSLERTGLQAAQAAPALLGANGPRTYLILAQNNHELRGTGGFISAIGFVRLDGGRITDLTLADSYTVDNFEQPHPQPPPALSEQMGAQLLLLRDSNWSPDFPATAQVARALFEQDQGIGTDGAIALDLEATRLMVGALGPLSLAGVAEPITAENAIATMKQAWQAPATSQESLQTGDPGGTRDWWLNRKDFMAELMTTALGKLESGADLDPAVLARALLAMLEERHLQIAVDDPALSELLAERGWDGALLPREGNDFLAVVDSNVGFNKANAAVQQEIAYGVNEASNGIEATLTLTYTHTASALPASEPCDRTPRYGSSYDDLIQRCFWDYLRVYVPAGSELLVADGLRRATAAPGEQNTTVLAGDFVLRPSEQHTVTLRYRLPIAAGNAPYRLDVRKQAGTLAPPLSVAVGQCQWSSVLDRDHTFECSTGTEMSPRDPIQARATSFDWQRASVLGALALVVLGLWFRGGQRATRVTPSGGEKDEKFRP
jgi:hypothetical protein